MKRIVIRTEMESDKPAVYAVNKNAFGQDAEARLVDLLREGNTFIPDLSIVAELDGEIVGHILFTRIKIVSEAGEEKHSLALAPMAVLPEFQRQGIGSKLVEYGLAKAKELGFPSVIVLGHEAYYPKFGFQPASKWGIKPPFDVSDSVFMAIELKVGGLEAVSGTVEYPQEFSSV